MILALCGALWLAAGCGGADRSSTPPPTASPPASAPKPATPAESAKGTDANPDAPPLDPTVTEVATTPEGAALLSDLVALRGAVDSAIGTSGSATNEFYDLGNEAAALEAQEGSDLILQRYPEIVPRVIDENERALAALRAVRPKSKYGNALKDVQIQLIATNVSLFRDLQDRVASATPDVTGWDIMVAWGPQLNEAVASFEADLRTFFTGLPPEVRADFIAAGEASGVDAAKAVEELLAG